MKGNRTLNNYYVYMHTTPSGKRYVGISKQQPEDRWQNGQGYRHSPYFYNAIKKYGWENITHEILFKNITHDEACRLEQLLIAFFQTTNRALGYNRKLGGEGGPLAEETKRKISEANKGKTGRSGVLHHMYGKHHSEESKRKMSEAAKRRCRPKRETVVKQIISRKDRWQDPEYREKMTKILTEANRKPERLKKISESSKRMWQSQEYREKRFKAMSGANNPSARAVMQYTLDGEYIRTWDTCKEAGESLGKAYSSICRCARGERKTAYGFKWVYVN